MQTRPVQLASVAIVFAMLAVVFAAVPQTAVAGNVGTRQGNLTLIVGGQDEMKIRNYLPAIANDVWTQDVLGRVYDTALQSHPVTKELVPYIIKGVDADGDGTFQRDEGGKFLREATDWQGNPCDAKVGTNFCALTVTAFYDFNGVYFHDGAQADVYDLLFTYHLFALNPRYNTDLRVIMDVGFTNNRQMDIEVVSDSGAGWQDAPPAGATQNLRASLTFTMNEPFALFYESTLSGTIFPQHVWEKFGQRGDAPVTPYATNIHGDFGCLIYPPTADPPYVDTTKKGTGIPSGAGDLPSACGTAYNYVSAEGWAMTDADVIGTGPFRFETWVQGGFAKVVRNDQFFIGKNPYSPFEVWDPYLLTYIKLPTIDAIVYNVYKSTTLGVLALRQSKIDFYHWNVPAEFVPELLADPNIAVEANPEPGFFYMAYNMRRVPWGYDGTGTDVGWEYRQAVSHLVDKKTIVQVLLNNFGVIGHGVISPANTFWYNDGITKPAYDTVLADQILDAKFGAWSPLAQPCTKDNPSMCRSLGTRGTALFEILTPQADYDPIRAASGQMIAAAMQSVGINVVSTPLAFGEIVARLDARNFDQYILGWRIGGTDPDYLFSFWDSSNAAGGQNYPGFNNATFDTTIRASRAELNRTLRHDLIFTAQDILADARPYEVLYYRTNIEGYRQDRFVNWTVSSGTIWNYYSLLGIRPPSEKRLTITPTLKSAVLSGLTAPLTVTVFDQARAKVAGASVRVELSAAGTGNLSDGTNPPASNVTVVTDASGQAVVSYIAPIRGVGNASLNVLIDMTANKQPEFPDEAFRTTQITVFAEGEQFLAVTTNLPNGDVTTPGGTLLLEVSVADQLGFPVSDADVTIESGSTQVTATPASGTSGTLPTVSLKALSTITASLNADLTVTANKTAFADGVTDFQISVVVSGSTSCPQGQVWDPTTNSCRQTTSTPGLEAVAIIALVGAIGAAAVVVRRREK